MGATATSRRRTGPALSGFLGTRRGSLTVAAIAAVLAAAGLAAYLSHYRTEVRGGAVPVQVLVADRLIPAGTAGSAVATERLFRPTSVSLDDAKTGALTDAAGLAGRTAVHDIYPGQQITEADFGKGGDQLRGQLTATQRAFAIPVDEAHGLVGNVRGGDKVDVLGSFAGRAEGRAKVHTIAQDVLVLKAPSHANNSSTTEQQPVVLRLTDKQSAQLAYAADYGKIWLSLRAPAGSTQSAPATVVESTVGDDQ